MAAEHIDCQTCGCKHSEAHAILKRVGREPSYAELWKRLDQAERDRNRMLNALQYIRDGLISGKIKLPPRAMAVINRALSRVEPSIARLQPREGGV